MVTERWKCPDCSAWVRDDVEEHTCEVKTSPSIWQWTGWTCSRCGTFVTSGNYHACWTWTPNTTTPPYYSSSSGNTSASAPNFTLYTNNESTNGDEDDGLDGVAVS